MLESLSGRTALQTLNGKRHLYTWWPWLRTWCKTYYLKKHHIGSASKITSISLLMQLPKLHFSCEEEGICLYFCPQRLFALSLNTFSPFWWHRAASTPLSEDVLRWMLNRPFFLSQGLTYGAVGAGKVTATGPTREQIYVTPTQTHTRPASDCELTIRLALLCHLQAGRIRRWRRVEVGRRAVIALPGPLGHSLR